MGKLINKMNETLKILLRQKGQGLTEFVLILAFCAAIGWIASEVGFLDAIGSVFDSGKRPEYVTAAIGGGGTNTSVSGGEGGSGSGAGGSGGGAGGSGGGEGGSGGGAGGSGGGGINWQTADPTSYYEDEASQAERLAMDQDALINIAKHFIGLTQKEVKYLLGRKNTTTTADMATNSEFVLGHFVPGEGNKGMTFKCDDYLIESQSQNIFAWMQGIDTELDLNADKKTVVENPNYDKDLMYLYSDYIVSQTWAAEAGSMQRNGLRIRLEYDYSNHTDPDPDGSFEYDDVKVIGVQLAIDPKSQHNDVLGLDISNNYYNEKNSRGLEVQVRLDGKDENGEDKYLITRNDTGVKITDTNYKGNGMTNWYGDGVTDAVKTYIQSNREDISGKTQDFTRGEIYKFKGNYYVVVKSAENVEIKSSYSQNDLEYDKKNPPGDSNIFVKCTGMNDRYYRENEYKVWNENNHCYEKRNIIEHGTLIIKGNGEVYIYVGTETNIPYNGIDVNDDNFIRIREKRENDDSIGNY